MLIGDDYDADTDEVDSDRLWVIKQLMQHPLLKDGAHPIFAREDEPPQLIMVPKTPTVLLEGLRKKEDWFQHQFGVSANDLVKKFRNKRRVHKEYREDIDDAIILIRSLKKIEVEDTLSNIPWAVDYIETIKGLGISDKDMVALKKYAGVRETSLQQACIQWENADNVISKLLKLEGNWSEQQRGLWVESLQKRGDAKKMWRNTLHQAGNLTKMENTWMVSASRILDEQGPMTSRNIVYHLSDFDGRNKSLTTQKIGAMLKMYGSEFDIHKNGSRWEKEGASQNLILKDPLAYAAGFLDADGYITITNRGEPRAGIIATGERGKVHCEQLYKTLGCGVLQLDLKVHKNSTRSQHRLQFYSKDDLRKLLKGISPHLQLKKKQADCVLQLLNLRGRKGDLITKRKDELYKIVKWENWKDVPEKAEELLREWNVDEQEVLSWGRSDPEAILLVDDANRVVGGI